MKQQTIAAPFGFSPDNWDIKVTNRTGAATVLGQPVAIDMTQTATESTTAIVGDEASGFANVRVLAAGDVNHGIVGICLAVAADNAVLRVRLSGIVEASYGSVGTTPTPAAGDPLVLEAGSAQTGNFLEHVNVATSATPYKIVAILLEAHAALVADTLVQGRVLFDGIHGFAGAGDIS